MDSYKIVIGSRGSQLALWQANWVKSELERINDNVEVSIQIIKTSGDKIQDVPLAKIGGKGLFVKEIEEALLAHEIDIAVHSMKDVPMKLPRELQIAVVTERESPLDALISKNGEKIADLPEGATVGTSSLRRSSQLLRYRPDLKIEMLRGNLDTRLKKLDEGQYDAIILAAAGLNRLGWADRITEEISREILLPAMGQGALGIETRINDVDVQKFICDLDHEATHWAVDAERAFVDILDGGCQVPIGAYATVDGREITVRGLVAGLDGKTIYQLDKTGPVYDADKLGRELGNELLKMGAAEILKEVLQ
ncbi:MAG: hydroxymethylbilane synthase [Nitrospinaceae bacterium]|jgi:hydroxymethylbilane synthase|nr:hydroxymethylbilane synthase [Nitrospinaceae bacterium]MDP7058477.1 hydroxymethylbilane synthase [Nitrospinaceae bacterium]HAK36628.1 hydroxymethylbilane synthase [Nitrospina sp.]|tara:strand:+ start:3462 stop:4388 length:927 start_codon:yes stop_codon:yes gene_type:complete